MGSHNRYFYDNVIDFEKPYVDVVDFGATGDGVTDDTAAINNAILYLRTCLGGEIAGRVYVPPGTYMIDMATSVQLRNNIELYLLDGATLKGIQTTSNVRSVINISECENSMITGEGTATIDGNKYASSGDFQWGILVSESTNIKISGLILTNCNFDGIYLAGSSSAISFSDNVQIENCICTNNGRSGIFFTSAKNSSIYNCEVSGSDGELPKSGIVLQPLYINYEFMENIFIGDCYCYSNGVTWEQYYCFGIDLALNNYVNNTNPFSIVVCNSRLVDNGRDIDSEQINYWQWFTPANGYTGTIEVSGLSYV